MKEEAAAYTGRLSGGLSKRRTSLLSTEVRLRTAEEVNDAMLNEPFTLGRPDDDVEFYGQTRRSSGLEKQTSVPNITGSRRSSLLTSRLDLISSSSRCLISFVLVIGLGTLSAFLIWSWLRINPSPKMNDRPYMQYHVKLLEAGHSNGYELVPDLINSDVHFRRALKQASEGRHEQNLKIKVGSVDVVLELTRATVFAPDIYEEVQVFSNGSRSRRKPDRSCIYRARVKGDADSFGVVSLCEQRPEVTMLHKSNSKLSFSLSQMDSSMHVLFVGSASKLAASLACGVDELYFTQSSSLRGLQSFVPQGQRNKTLRVVIVNDVARYSSLGTSTESTTAAILELVGQIYALVYSSSMYGINVQLVGQLTFTSTDGWNTTNDPTSPGQVNSQTLLDDFYTWKSTYHFSLPTFDLVHLFSGRQFSGGIVGRAAQGGVCTDRNVAVDQMMGFDNRLYSRIAAHEMGHGLSLSHDNTYSDPSCTNDTNTFLWPMISIADNPHWTTCALSTIKSFVEYSNPDYTYLGCLDGINTQSAAPTMSPTKSTHAPSSRAPTSSSPTSRAPSTRVPSHAPTSSKPTSRAPSSASPSSASPTSVLNNTDSAPAPSPDLEEPSSLASSPGFVYGIAGGSFVVFGIALFAGVIVLRRRRAAKRVARPPPETTVKPENVSPPRSRVLGKKPALDDHPEDRVSTAAVPDFSPEEAPPSQNPSISSIIFERLRGDLSSGRRS